MKNNNLLNIAILILVLFTSSCSSHFVYNFVKSKSQCSSKNGYWYNNKCWKDFEDEGILKSDIDSTVSAQMKIIEKSNFTINNQTYPLIAFLPIEEKEGMLLIAVYGTKDNFKTLLFPTGKKKMKTGSFETLALMFDGDAISGNLDKETKLKGTAVINIIDLESLDVEISGKILSKENSHQNFSFKANEAILGAGNSYLEVKGNEAYLSGDLGTITYWQIKDLIKNHPKIKTIVMTHISGSVNDAVNMHTGRLLRENGFTTKVLSNSDIASGGVDLFCAGVKRIVVKGAKIGIHSWCCVDDVPANKLPKDHPAHQYQLEYYSMCLGKDLGSQFYFKTLEAAPANDIYYMTDNEIREWQIATEFIENE